MDEEVIIPQIENQTEPKTKKKIVLSDTFLEYFKTNFVWREGEFDDFLENLGKPLKKTIRINTRKISVEDFIARMEPQGWTLTPTPNPIVFYVDRTQVHIPLGNTLEHLMGFFYIQELSASMSVHHLTNGNVSHEPLTILDMAASPGGKTTQLAEMYPNGYIIANEPTRDRIVQLISNAERMGDGNIALTNYSGAFFSYLPETFDRVLLDAPCSGEGTAFRGSGVLKYWNIKNIKKIASVQKRLFESALITLKTGGEMLYSTCTLNTVENEEVVQKIAEKYPNTFEIVFQKRFWPHTQESGGFFVCKIKKIAPIPNVQGKDGIPNIYIFPASPQVKAKVQTFAEKVWMDLSHTNLYSYKTEVLAVPKETPFLKFSHLLYLFRFSTKIGRMVHAEFEPYYIVGRDFHCTKLPVYSIPSEAELNKYLQGHQIMCDFSDPYIQIGFADDHLGLAITTGKKGVYKNLFPKDWQRK